MDRPPFTPRPDQDPVAGWVYLIVGLAIAMSACLLFLRHGGA
jgi:hypothetical protein